MRARAKKLMYSHGLLVVITFLLFVKILLLNFFIGRGLPEHETQLFTALGISLIFSSLSYLFRKPIIFFLLLGTGTSFYFLINVLYFRNFNEPFSLFNTLQFNNLAGLGPSIFVSFRWMDVLLVSDVIVLLLVGVFKGWRFTNKFSKRTVVTLFLLGALCFTAKPLKYVVVDNVPLAEAVKVSYRIYDRTNYLVDWTPFGLLIHDVMSVLKSNSFDLSEVDRKEIERWYREHRQQLTFNSEFHGISQGKNVILIQVESLENFVIGRSINGQEITPHLNSIIRSNGVYFQNFYSQVKGGHSSDAELIANTSLLPVEEGSTFFRFPDNTYPSLPSLLSELGYKSIALHGDYKTYWNRVEAYPNLGFQENYDLDRFEYTEKLGMGLSDLSFTRQSAEILAKQSQPFYAMLITLTSHTPFKIPVQLHGLDTSNITSSQLLSDYLQSIHYTDQSIGLFFDLLEHHRLLDDSLIVIYGDHNAIQWNEKETISKNRELAWVADRRIPLIIYDKSLPSMALDTIGGQIDLFPTIAELLGLPAESLNDSVMGRSLFSVSQGYAVSSYQNDYFAENVDSELIKHAIEVPRLSNLIILGDYFHTEGANK